ncbi:MAG TPA: hypothetical protein PLB42_01210 [Kiritimatiellia bacterium]|nr:hypothetical protein [Kiritimatiellia bacterium]
MKRKYIVLAGFALWVAHLATAEEIALTDDQKRDRADIIAVLTVSAIVKGSNYTEHHSFSGHTADKQPVQVEYTDEIQEWLIQYRDAKPIKGELPSEGQIRAIEEVNVVCPHFNVHKFIVDQTYIVFISIREHGLGLLHSSNQSALPLTSRYSLTWFEATKDPHNPYELKTAEMTQEEYIRWLAK